MFQNTNVVFLNTFNAILNIMDANACVPSVEFIYSVLSVANDNGNDNKISTE